MKTHVLAWLYRILICDHNYKIGGYYSIGPRGSSGQPVSPQIRWCKKCGAICENAADPWQVPNISYHAIRKVIHALGLEERLVKGAERASRGRFRWKDPLIARVDLANYRDWNLDKIKPEEW